MRVVLTGGGTAGHISPALAIAEALQARPGDSIDIHYIGMGGGLEQKLVPRAGLPFHAVHAGGLLKPGLWSKVVGGLRAARGLWQSYITLGRLAPDVVVGTGGYVSGPVGLAAAWRSIPLVLLEPDVWPGLTNRMLARRAHTVMVPYAEAVKHLPEGTRVKVTGTPVRPSLVGADRTEARRRLGLDPEWTVLLAFGGSLGAPAINRLMTLVWPTLAAEPTWAVIWATGPRHFASVAPSLTPPPDDHRLRVVDYWHEMDWAFAAADVLVGRAGANTCAEAQARGVPALLVPSPYVTGDHQRKNAEYLAGHGAALVVLEDRIETEGLASLVGLLRDADVRRRMGLAARAMFRPDAMTRILDTILAAAAGTEGSRH